MNNLIDYVNWRGDLSFDVSPLNEIDLSCFTMLFALHFDGIIPENDDSMQLSEALEIYFSRRPEKEAGSELGILEPKNAVPLARQMRDSERYSGIRVSGYRRRIREAYTEQFGAVTLDLPGDLRLIVYLATDDTIVGWKEDFMLSVSGRLTAQNDALQYLEAAAVPGKRLILAGHSKGGNLSLYAAIFADSTVQDRIVRAYSMDGPGFETAILENEGYERIRRKLITIRSQNSIIGMLLNAAGKCVTVRSGASGPLAHDPFTWEVQRNRFNRTQKLSSSSLKFQHAISATLAHMSDRDRITFINELFDLLAVDGAKTLTEVSKAKLLSRLEAAAKLKEKPEVVSFLREMLEEYLLPDSLKRIRLLAPSSHRPPSENR